MGTSKNTRVKIPFKEQEINKIKSMKMEPNCF